MDDEQRKNLQLLLSQLPDDPEARKRYIGTYISRMLALAEKLIPGYAIIISVVPAQSIAAEHGCVIGGNVPHEDVPRILGLSSLAMMEGHADKLNLKDGPIVDPSKVN